MGQRLFTRSDEDLDRERQEYAEGAPPDLTQYFQAFVEPDRHNDFIEDLLSLPYVETAYTMPVRTPPPKFYPSRQPHLREMAPPSAYGVDAEHAWKKKGHGDEIQVAIIDYHWFKDHDDLPNNILEPGPAPEQDILNHPDSFWRDHGTASLGVIAAQHEADKIQEKGMRGIAPQVQAQIFAADSKSGPEVNVADAISLATGSLSPGDIILIEQQACRDCQYDAQGNLVNGTLLPIEYKWKHIGGSKKHAVFDAIRRATRKGIIVVEPAGNGQVSTDNSGGVITEGVDLDAQDAIFNEKDSGAIMVGAGMPARQFSFDPEPLSRFGPSNYGSRVNVQGWGYRVGTLGYGRLPIGGILPGPGNENQFYTDDFAGTSAAAAIVAGVAAALQSIYKDKHGKHEFLEPLKMRKLLIDTGTAQANNGAEHIGPLPNLKEAIAELP